MDQQRKEEEEEEEEEEGSVLLKEPTDQRREEEEESTEEPAERRSEEPTDQGKAAAAEADAERSSDEESMAASALFVHPCSLLRYLLRAFACCLGMPEDSFGGGGTVKRSADAAAPASVDSSREGDADRSTGAATGFYVQEVITRVFAVRRPRPSGPGNPREGNGGNGGHHH